jgi:hypothetical protein
MALKDWKKIKGVPTELDEGDNFHAIWEKDGLYLFIVDDNFGEFIVGEKYMSQMDEPRIIDRAKTKALALKLAKSYMEKH